MFEKLPGGAGLAEALDAARPAELDDVGLVEAMRAWERLAGWVAAGQLAVVAELAVRRPRDYVEAGRGRGDRGDPVVPHVSEFAVDELAAALRLSRPAAGVRLQLAVELATRLPETAAALRDGMVDVPRARAVVEAVAPLGPALAAAVEQRVLPRAGRQTVGQLRASLARAVLAADPAAAERRHQRAVAERQVTVRPLPDGVAGLWALLPADGAAALYARLDDLARRAPAGDPRPMDARRADALLSLTLTDSPTPSSTEPAAEDQLPAGPARLRAHVHVTLAATTALGLDQQPGHLAGHGPVPASMARRLAGTGSWRKVTTDPASGTVTALDPGRYTPAAALADLVRTRDATCRFPGCRQPAHRCDLDHVVPWPAGATAAANLATLCRPHHRLKHQTQWTVHAGAGGELTWTSPTGHRYTTTPPEP